MSLIVLSGLLATDLSTVSRQLAESFDRGVHVRSDVFRRMIVHGQAPMGPDPQDSAMRELRLRSRLACLVADEYALAGYTVVLQEVIVGELLYEALAATVTRPRYVVELGPATDDAYDDLGEHSPRRGVWIDDSGLRPDETVERILKRLDEGLID